MCLRFVMVSSHFLRWVQAPGTISMHVILRRIQFIVTLYSLLFLLPKDHFHRVGLLEPGPGRPRVCPRPTICSEGIIEIGLLAGARLSALYMLVPISAVFLTKARLALAEWNKTILSIIVPAFDLHQIHVSAGWQVAACSLFHVACHCGRFIKRGTLGTISLQPVGWSGWIAFAMLFPVALLQLSVCRRLFSYEIRKPAHLIGALIFAVAGIFHGRFALPIVLYLSCTVYMLDVIYTNFWRTWRVENSEFVRLGRGTELTFHLPPHWPDHFEGYVNVLVPWISRWQWHAFSAYASIDRPGFASVFALDSGDWTKALHASIARDTRRPVWIQGPIPSPYGERAADFDYMVLVATGVGITPALSCITKFAKTGRSLVLIWTCRDPSLVAFYRHRLADTVLSLIFYTGKEPIKVDGLPSHVRVLDKRPDLAIVVPDCMRCVEHNAALPADVRRRAADFLVSMNNTYAGIFECSQGAVRLRFDTFMSATLRLGRTPTELVHHFVHYLHEAHMVHTHGGAATAASDVNETQVRLSAFHADTENFSAIPDDRGSRGDAPSWVNYLPFGSSVLSHAAKGNGTRSGFSSNTVDLEHQSDHTAHLDSKIFDADIFGRAFSALATDVVTFGFDDCVELIRTISEDGDSMCSINELHAALEHLRVVNVRIDTHQKALRCKMQQQKQQSHGNPFWRNLATPSKLAGSFRDLLSLSSKINSEKEPTDKSSSLPEPLGTEAIQNDIEQQVLSSADAKTSQFDELKSDVVTDIEEPHLAGENSDIICLITDDSEDPANVGECKTEWVGEQTTPQGTMLKSSSYPSLPANEEGDEDVSLIHLDVSKDRWGIMYCGGVAQVQATLRDVAHTLGVPLALEQFNW